MSDSSQIFTLKQVVASIRKTLEERYRQTYWVKAEMHKLNRYPSGHCFPELVQKEDGKMVAQITGSIWKHNFERINDRFTSVVKEPLREGTTLLMHVRIAFHETYGLSLQIMDIDPSYSLGELQRERQETLKKLQKEGILNRNQERDFPLLPKRVAIISATSSKGLSDFMKVIHQNTWNYRFMTHLFPAYLQGDPAVPSIIQQLQRIQQLGDLFDIVVIVRGGGGEVGLSCYNNYELCRAIALFPLPILTGIGHSTNLTVAEMIAYRNAITPTELADFLIQAFHNFAQPVEDAQERLQRAVQQWLRELQRNLTDLSLRVKTNGARAVVNARHGLLHSIQQLRNNTVLRMRQEDYHLEQASKGIQHAVKTSIREQRHEMDAVSGRLNVACISLLRKQHHELQQLERSVQLMDPIHVLRRGYSISTIDGKIIGKGEEPHKGQEILTRTATFMIHSEVKRVKSQNNE